LKKRFPFRVLHHLYKIRKLYSRSEFNHGLATDIRTYCRIIRRYCFFFFNNRTYCSRYRLIHYRSWLYSLYRSQERIRFKESLFFKSTLSKTRVVLVVHTGINLSNSFFIITSIPSFHKPSSRFKTGRIIIIV